jgi:rhomboid protease GluP
VNMEHGLTVPPSLTGEVQRRRSYFAEEQTWWLPKVSSSACLKSVTGWTMIAQIAVFAATVGISGGFVQPGLNATFGPSRCSLIATGAKFSPFIVHKMEYWRILSANYVHSGLITLLISLIFEYLIMLPVEIENGRLITLLVFALSGATGYAFSTVASPTSVDTGALAPVMGFVGFRLAYAVLDWPSIGSDDRRRVGALEAGTAFIVLVVGQSPFVDNYSAFASFVIGCFLGGAFFGDKIDGAGPSQKIVVAMAVLATVFVMFVVGFLLAAGQFPLIDQVVFSTICKYDSNIAPFRPFDFITVNT